MSEIVLSCNNLGKSNGDIKGRGAKEKCGWKVNKAPHFIVHISFMEWQSKDYFAFFKFVHLSGYHSEKAMATHSNTLAWKIPWMEEPRRLQSMGSPRVGHDWATSLWLFTFMHWRRKWQPTPVFLPIESQGCGSLVGCRLWGCTESDMTEVT